MRIKLDIPLYLNEISAALNAINLYHSNVVVEYLTTDSRKLEIGDLFIPLKGERHNGEDFVEECLQKGGICITTKRRSNCITVTDTEEALLRLANYYKTKYRKLKHTVAITGSVGKTTTKEILKKLCSATYKTYATKDNQNNQIGLPLTILSAPKDTEILILEMGMNHSGEISRLSKCATPDIAVITKIGTAHIGNLDSRENIARAKLEIVDGTKDCKLVIPYGEPLLNDVKNAYTFSTKHKNAYIYINNNEGNLTICTSDSCVNVKTDLLGDAITECLCAATVAALLSEVNLKQIKDELSFISNDISRQKFISFGVFDVLADYYNASYESVISSLDFLSTLKKYSSKGALLGSIYELGDKANKIHYNIGVYAAKSRLDNLFIFGEYANDVFNGAVSGGMAKEKIYIIEDTTDFEKAAVLIKKHSIKNEIILFKASHAVNLGRVVEHLQKIVSNREES